MSIHPPTYCDDRPASDLAIDRLGRCLYERLEHLDPGMGEYVEWAALSEREQHLYRLCIEEIFDREPDAASDMVAAYRSATTMR